MPRRSDGTECPRLEILQRAGLDTIGPLTRFGPSAAATPTGLLERRSIKRPNLVKLRAEGDGVESWTIAGHSVLFNVWTEIGYWYKYRERIAPGAAAKTIAEGDIRSCFNHDPTWLLGRTKANTHRLEEDEIGVAFETDLNADDPHGQSVRAKVDRGDVDGCSFWFRVLREEWTYADDDNGLDMDECTITEFQMFEDGPVTFPAYEETDVALRMAAPMLRAELAVDLDDAAHPVLRALRDGKPLVAPKTEPTRAASKAPGTGGNDTPAQSHLSRTREHELLAARLGLSPKGS